MIQTYSEIGWNIDNSYARLPSLFFSKQNPTPVPAPKLSLMNKELALSLGLDVRALQSGQGLAIFAGNAVPNDAIPLAQAYAGHQFGHFTMLGDGRALLIGEHITPSGERFDIHLKGSGKTPYTRGGDGRATLGPMLREYMISEAMHALGIPTTRSLAVVATGEPVIRETALPGAILTRVAASHLRVGTFEFAAQWGKDGELQALVDYAIERHFPEITDESDKYLLFLHKVVKNQAHLISKWQLVGFIHGVMNTDNMTISGETIDYGPCAFMDTYDQATVFSSIDREGRYAYGNQPRIGEWNLARFAEALLPLLHEDQERAIELAQEALSLYAKSYSTYSFSGMKAKLGLFKEEKDDLTLIQQLLYMMQKYKADFTNTFKALTIDEFDDLDLFSSPEFKNWYQLWQARLAKEERSKTEIKAHMKQNNPAVIPRNHRVEEALEAAVERDDYRLVKKLLAVLKNPYEYSIEQEEYSQLPEPSDEPYQTYCGT